MVSAPYLSPLGYVGHCHFSMRVCEAALFLLPVWNLSSLSYSSTPISYMARKFRRFANIIGINWQFKFGWIFRTFWPQMAVFGGKIVEGVVRCWPPNELVLTFAGCYLCATFGEKSITKCDRESAYRQTDRHTQRQTESMICSMLYATAMRYNKVTLY